MRRVWMAATVCACMPWGALAGDAPAAPPPSSTAQDLACTTCDARQAAKMRMRDAKKNAEKATEREAVGAAAEGSGS